MREEDFSTKFAVEEFCKKFAHGHCAAEAKQFLPLPPPKSPYKRNVRHRATIKRTTNKHQTKLRATLELM